MKEALDRTLRDHALSVRCKSRFSSLAFTVILATLLVVLTGCNAQQPQSTNGSNNSSSSGQAGGSATIEDKTSSGNGSSGESAKTEETKSFKMGDTIKTDNYEIVLSSVEWVDEIYPPDVSGYYSYYENEEGKTYIVMHGTYKNLWTGKTMPHWATNPTFVFNDKYKIDAQIEVVNDGRMSNSFAIDPLESSEIYVWASVSDEMKGSVTSTKLVWEIPRDKFDTYYSSSDPHDTYEVAF